MFNANMKLNAKTLGECVELAGAARQNLADIEYKFNEMGLCDDDLSGIIGMSYSYLHDDLLVGLGKELKVMLDTQKAVDESKQDEINKAIQLLMANGMLVRSALDDFDSFVNAGEYGDARSLLDEVYPAPDDEFISMINNRIKQFPIDKIEFSFDVNDGWYYDENHE